MSLVVIFPATGAGDTAAAGYLTFCNGVATPALSPWDDPAKRDRYGQRVVGYYGPGGHVEITDPEPEGGPEAREAGILQEGFDAIEEEDE